MSLSLSFFVSVSLSLSLSLFVLSLSPVTAYFLGTKSFWHLEEAYRQSDQAQQVLQCLPARPACTIKWLSGFGEPRWGCKGYAVMLRKGGG